MVTQKASVWRENENIPNDVRRSKWTLKKPYEVILRDRQVAGKSQYAINSRSGAVLLEMSLNNRVERQMKKPVKYHEQCP